MKLAGNYSTFFKAVFLGPLYAALIILPITILAVSINEGALNIEGGAGMWIVVAPIGFINAVISTMFIASMLWKHLPINDIRKSYIYSTIAGFLGGTIFNLFSLISILNFISGARSSSPSIFEAPVVFFSFAAMGMLVGVCFNYVLNRSLAKTKSGEG